jgi:hypothetical protein
MPNREEIQMQSGATSKSERDRIEQGYDEFTHDYWSIIPLAYGFNCDRANGVLTRAPH